jgi:hypothetical protein
MNDKDVPRPCDDQNPVPDASWTIDDLRRYAAERLGEAVALARRSTVQVFRAGRALCLIKGKVESDEPWIAWLQRNDMARTSAWEAMKLFERAKEEAAIADIPITEAKKTYGIVKPRRDTGGRPSKRRRAKSTQPAPTAPAAVPSQPSAGEAASLDRDLDAVAANLGEEYRQAILHGDAQPTREEIRLMASASPLGVRLIEAESPPPEEPGEEVDGQKLDVLVRLWRDANQPTKLAFLRCEYVRAALRRLPEAA